MTAVFDGSIGPLQLAGLGISLPIEPCFAFGLALPGGVTVTNRPDFVAPFVDVFGQRNALLPWSQDVPLVAVGALKVALHGPERTPGAEVPARVALRVVS